MEPTKFYSLSAAARGCGLHKQTMIYAYNNKTNDLILNLTPENMTQHSRIE